MIKEERAVNQTQRYRQEERDQALIDGLERYGMATKRQLKRVLKEQKKTGKNIEEIVLKEEIVSRGMIIWMLKKMLNAGDFKDVLPLQIHEEPIETVIVEVVQDPVLEPAA